ncbi:MAG: lasso RiPP family leader peptide-containing protein [Sciscionella sp.]
MAASAFQSSSESEVQYEPPTLDELGEVVELTRGTAADDTADMKTAKYW